MVPRKDAYEMAGGDAAWRAWLDICSVAGVQEQCPDLAEGLRSQERSTGSDPVDTVALIQ